jgi:hypothetical protein
LGFIDGNGCKGPGRQYNLGQNLQTRSTAQSDDHEISKTVSVASPLIRNNPAADVIQVKTGFPK